MKMIFVSALNREVTSFSFYVWWNCDGRLHICCRRTCFIFRKDVPDSWVNPQQFAIIGLWQNANLNEPSSVELGTWLNTCIIFTLFTSTDISWVLSYSSSSTKPCVKQPDRDLNRYTNVTYTGPRQPETNSRKLEKTNIVSDFTSYQILFIYLFVWSVFYTVLMMFHGQHYGEEIRVLPKPTIIRRLLKRKPAHSDRFGERFLNHWLPNANRATESHCIKF